MNTFCDDCANKQQEAIDNVMIHWEGNALYCDNCNKKLPSIYGDDPKCECGDLDCDFCGAKTQSKKNAANAAYKTDDEK